jgi:hypothetical protein
VVCLTLGGSVHELSKDSVFCCDSVDFIYFHLMTVLQFLNPFILGFIVKKREKAIHNDACNTHTHVCGH